MSKSGNKASTVVHSNLDCKVFLDIKATFWAYDRKKYNDDNDGCNDNMIVIMVI